MKTKTTGRVAREGNTSPTTVRNLVKKGVLSPLVLSDGRFAFDEEDVRIVRERPALGPGGRPLKKTP